MLFIKTNLPLLLFLLTSLNACFCPERLKPKKVTSLSHNREMSQGLEIERKFLVNNLDFLENKKGELYKQAYVLKDSLKLLRVRLTEHEAFITIKKMKTMLSRLEFEYKIPVEDAKRLIEITDYHVIEKIRYKIPYKGNLWEVDVFQGGNKGLVIAEIELSSENHTFEKPTWLSEEVSHDFRYFNSYLAENPFSKW